ncbi:MAG: cytochrome C biogenesis protein [Betaproteobacteria bacterium]|nr:MAG: cytochrome C biogenesis protein [Betaproteobacteria bacterium]
MPDILLYAVTSLLYAALGLHFWRTRWTGGGAAGGEEGSGIVSWERLAILAPFLLHSYLLYASLFAATELRFGFSQALSVTLWLTVLIYWVESMVYDVKGMQALVLPLAALCALLPAFFPGPETPAYTQTVAFRIHLLVAMLAYSLFTIAALHATLMTVLERHLHSGMHAAASGESLAGPWASLPPLMTLEKLLFQILSLGFVLLSLTLASGFVFSEELFGQAARFNHKTVFGIASWIIFAALLIGRYGWGWRGRTALRWTLAGFAALLLAYVGSMFVLEVILGRV